MFLGFILVVSSSFADGYINTRPLNDNRKLGGAPKPQIVTQYVKVPVVVGVQVKDTQRVVDKLTQEQRIAIMKVINAWEKDTKDDLAELKRILTESYREQNELEQKAKKEQLKVKID